MTPISHRIIPVAAFVAISAIFFLFAIHVSSMNLLWYDEIFTLRIARLPDIATVLDAVEHPVDLQPPLYFIIVRASMKAIGETHLGARLPSMIGVWIMTVCVFAFLRRRNSILLSCSGAALALMFRSLSQAWEARPYGLVLGLSGIVLLSWQRATDSPHRKLALACLALGLAAGPCVSYYAVLLWVPLGFGELVRSIRSRRVDWPIWTILFLALLPFLAHLRYILPATVSASSTKLWNAPTLESLVTLYPALLANAYPTFFVLFAILLVMRTKHPEAVSMLAHETAVLWGLIATPIFGFVLALLVTHVIHSRYVLFSVIGFGCLFALSMRRMLPAHRWRDLLIFLVAMVSLCMAARQALTLHNRLRPPAEVLSRRLPTQVEDSGLPVVIGSGLNFWPLTYYAPQSVRERICFVADMDVAARRTGNVSVDGGLLATMKHFKPRVYPWSEFRKTQRQFYLVWPRRENVLFEWLLPEVQSLDAEVENVGSWGGDELYLVTLPQNDLVD
jgi:hypothetical protein